MYADSALTPSLLTSFIVLQDNGYPCSELTLSRTPEGGKGWCTPQGCSYPQEFTIKLQTLTSIRQIKILSHEYKIAKKMEIQIASLPEAPDASQVSFKRLGHITFDANEASAYGARELKTVNLDDVPAHIVRFIVYGAHNNHLNAAQQVSLVSLSVVGKPIFPTTHEMPELIQSSNIVTMTSSKARACLTRDTKESGPLPAGDRENPKAKMSSSQISVDMGVDMVTAQKISDLQLQKQAAVDKEDYDEAKRMKAAIDRLKAVGVRIAALEARKKAAVDAEDYDQAKELKSEIERLRAGATQSDQPDLRVSLTVPPPTIDVGFVSDDKMKTQERQQSEVISWESLPNTKINRNSMWSAYDERPAVARGSYNVEVSEEEAVATLPSPSPVRQSRMTASATPPAKMLTNAQEARATDVSAQPAEDAGDPGPCPEGFSTDLPPPSPIAQADLKDGAPLAHCLGEYVARAAVSKNWQLREAAFNKIRGDYSNSELHGDMARTLCRHLIPRGLKDRVPAVAGASLSLLKTVVESTNKLKEVSPTILELLPLLAERACDTNVRVRDQATETIVMFAGIQELNLISSSNIFLYPQKGGAAPKALVARISLVSQLLPVIGIGGGSCFSLEALMAFLKGPLSHSNAEVRSSASALVVQIGQKVGPTLVKFLPAGLNPKLKDSLLADLGAAPAIAHGAKTSPNPSGQRSQQKNIASNPAAYRQRSPPPPTGSPGTSGGATIPAYRPSKKQTNASSTPSSPPHTDLNDLALFEEELATREAALGLRHPAVAEALTNLAIVRTQQGLPDEALPLYQRAVNIYENAEGAHSLNVAHTLTDMAVIYLESGQDEAGRPLLERALKIQESLMGPHHPDVVAIREVLQEQWGGM